jgi:hypothetical protein
LPFGKIFAEQTAVIATEDKSGDHTGESNCQRDSINTGSGGAESCANHLMQRISADTENTAYHEHHGAAVFSSQRRHRIEYAPLRGRDFRFLCESQSRSSAGEGYVRTEKRTESQADSRAVSADNTNHCQESGKHKGCDGADYTRKYAAAKSSKDNIKTKIHYYFHSIS